MNRLVDLLHAGTLFAGAREATRGTTSSGAGEATWSTTSCSVEFLHDGAREKARQYIVQQETAGEKTYLAIDSSSFCLSSYSSFEASCELSSQEMVSLTADSSLDLSAGSNLPASFSSVIELRRLYAYDSRPFLAVIRAAAASSSARERYNQYIVECKSFKD